MSGMNPLAWGAPQDDTSNILAMLGTRNRFVDNAVGTEQLGQPQVGMPAPGGFDPVVSSIGNRPVTASQAADYKQYAANMLNFGSGGLSTAARGLGLDSAAMKVLRDMTPGAKTATMDNPAFAKWFGASKGVDETGNPATYYHGTNSDFDTFQRIDGGNQYGEGHYFTKSPQSGSNYATGENVNRMTPEGNAGPNVMPVKLAFDKPYDRRGMLSPSDIKSLEEAANETEPGKWKRGELSRMFDKAYPANGDNVAYQLGSDANQIIRKAGFDAMVDPNMTVVFKPTQIKSAIGNSGAFNTKDPRITAGIAGLMAGGTAAAAGTPQQ